MTLQMHFVLQHVGLATITSIRQFFRELYNVNGSETKKRSFSRIIDSVGAKRQMITHMQGTQRKLWDRQSMNFVFLAQPRIKQNNENPKRNIEKKTFLYIKVHSMFQQKNH